MSAARRRMVTTRCLALLMLAVLSAAGCQDDPGTVPRPGAILVLTTPADLQAAWTIQGPEGFTATGAGDGVVDAGAPGLYSVTWDTVTWYLRPDTATGELSPPDTLVLRGQYALRAGTPPAWATVPAGSFIMGSPPDEPTRDPDETAHPVTLTRGFVMSRFEVTESWWREVMDDTTVADSQLPVINVSWQDAVEFCNRLSAREGREPAYTLGTSPYYTVWNRDTDGYRLPTEAEWEYACRAGGQEAFSSGPMHAPECEPLDFSLDQVGWYCGNSGWPGGDRQPVGSKASNAWGLHDLHGNVAEWVWDGYLPGYETLPAVDPAYEMADSRVIRGGYWANYAGYCRSAYRMRRRYDQRIWFVGFRPVRWAD